MDSLAATAGVPSRADGDSARAARGPFTSRPGTGSHLTGHSPQSACSRTPMRWDAPVSEPATGTWKISTLRMLFRLSRMRTCITFAMDWLARTGVVTRSLKRARSSATSRFSASMPRSDRSAPCCSAPASCSASSTMRRSVSSSKMASHIVFSSLRVAVVSPRVAVTSSSLRACMVIVISQPRVVSTTMKQHIRSVRVNSTSVMFVIALSCEAPQAVGAWLVCASM
mmetsp:Transcript_90421/g.235401  ORF Transcript_90421/g.235401 Transcript_90421/m.235401 type:complete len:226 (+) Transcript_90421:1187-1864(+)